MISVKDFVDFFNTSFNELEEFEVEDKQENFILTFTLTVVIFFVGTSILAMVTYPHYSFSQNYLSALGTSKNPLSFIFNSSVIITAILLIPTYYAIYKIMKRNIMMQDIKFLNFSFGLAILSSLSLLLVGLIPANPQTLIPHLIAAGLFFLSIGFYYVIITFLMLKVLHFCANYKRFTSIWDYLGFSIIILVLIFIDLNTWYNKLIQKTIVYGSLLLLIYVSNKLRKIDRDESCIIPKPRESP